ncbi:hypothetical protein CWIS_14425 [Cellulomonas sp. A375-1]|nr:hypothetical protein CWIS_14425 [Cellulomonas sp. A375-1]
MPSAPFHPTLDAETCEPDVCTSAFHDCATFWPEAGQVQATFHDEMAEPRLVIFTSPWKPPGHWLWTV